ncbi:MAG: hypothetical protein R3F14_35310 [Polyangiaceae bacterium]
MSSRSRFALAFALVSIASLGLSCDDPGEPGGTGGSTTTTDAGATGGSGGTGASTDPTGGGGTGATGGGGAGATGGASTGGGGAGGTGGAGGAGGSSGGTGGGGGTGGAANDGYGTLSGMCGDINLDDIQSPDPELLQNVLDFTGRPAFDVGLLSPGGQAIWDAGNLGGSSIYSEIFAYEVLYWCDGAGFLKPEGDIVYTDPMSKKTDLLVDIDGEKVGVSVVRAVSFPKGNPYPVSQAFSVLDGKLSDILVSSANVAPEDAWSKQILAVIAQTPDHALAIAEAWQMIDPATKADTIVLVTVTEGDDDFVYYNQ